MHLRQWLIRNRTFAFAITLYCIICIPTNTFAQVTSRNTPIVHFGDVDASLRISRQGLLANPRLNCTLPNCKVVGYGFAIMPKGGDFRGQFHVSGSELDATCKNVVNTLEPGGETSVFIDDIHVKVNGRDSSLKKAAYVFKCFQ